MNSSQIEYVYHLFPNPSTVELKFKRSGDHLSLIIHQNIGIIFLHYKGKSVNILDEYVLTEMDQVRVVCDDYKFISINWSYFL